VKAKVKELAGTLVGYKALTSQAKADFNTGKAQAKFGDAKSAVVKRRSGRRGGFSDAH
jgi:uncharacterized protein YjbJ (UPF0337 family)